MFNQEKFAQILELVKSKNNLGEEIYIVGATKTIPIDEINLAISKGLKIVAENRVQEFREKTDLIVGASQHFIGHLQTNKVKYLVGKVDLIHSIDSFHLASAVSECAKRKNIVQDVLVEINIGGELSKSGINPQNAISEIEKISSLDGIKVKGLMAMLPKTRDKEKLQALTLQMREIFDKVKKV